MYKLAKGISLAMMQEILKIRNNKKYNLRSQNTFEIPFTIHKFSLQWQ